MSVDGSIKLKDTKNKYIFWDIDGTLAPYRFNDHVGDPDGTENGMSIEEINEHVFMHRDPSRHMQRVLKECMAKENIVMGHCQIRQELEDKQVWLDRHYPEIVERLLVYESHSKADTILEYCKEKGIELKDVVFVDDVIPFLREAERKGIRSYHISSFLDWDLQW